jgi:glycine betaine/proline transport system substrate-binding protein
LAGLLLAALLAACTSSLGSADEAPADQQVEADGGQLGDEPRARVEFRPTITLGVTDWTAARLNAAIAERIIELRLGYPVETADVIDNGAMMNELQTGDLDAVLEVWPSTLEPDEREAVASGEVDRLGDLGVVGKVGWYVPRFVVEQQPSLATWEGFDDPEVATGFSTLETGELGRFLGTNPNYEQADEELIAALGLPFQVEYSGSDQATRAEVERAIAADRPVVLFWWTPTAEIPRFDLVEVELPPRTAACEAEMEAGGPQRCDYEPDRILKLGSPGLAVDAPEVHRFLINFTLSTAEQLDLIAKVENDSRSVSSVADEWVADNASTWSNWLE